LIGAMRFMKENWLCHAICLLSFPAFHRGGESVTQQNVV
jgi:hypothetical protein